MTPADYVPFVTPVLLTGNFMWMWREHRELRSFIDSRFDKVNGRIDGLQSEMRAELRVFNKSLNELSTRVGRLEGAIMHAFRGALFGDELEDSKESQSQLAARYEASKKNDQESA